MGASASARMSSTVARAMTAYIAMYFFSTSSSTAATMSATSSDTKVLLMPLMTIVTGSSA